MERLLLRNARYLAQDYLKQQIMKGECVCDATAGNGGDTQLLCELVGDTGTVYAFDIQREALDHTKERLSSLGLEKRAVLFECGHERMREYIFEPLQAVVFNLGWLPGGDHGITTRTGTTLAAFEAAAQLLAPGGLLSVCVYPGHEEGKKELEACEKWFSGLPVRYWTVLQHRFLNAAEYTPQLFLAQKNPL